VIPAVVLEFLRFLDMVPGCGYGNKIWFLSKLLSGFDKLITFRKFYEVLRTFIYCLDTQAGCTPKLPRTLPRDTSLPCHHVLSEAILRDIPNFPYRL
jgi:hypothetical protein